MDAYREFGAAVRITGRDKLRRFARRGRVVFEGVDGLVVNHLEISAGAQAATAYATRDGVRTALEPGIWQDLAHQTALTEFLTTATPL
ncbi:hypothetical protein [Nocardia sp. NBC_01329]|uniref:hypothetical protein n=1 Tax=Nocardia sp. NBC_01329 TaxID=2903594 RepID=UPI002E0E02C3|nr:hypothetical protein OG405_09860 [Nocardia sp. NBC_01329]